MRHALKKYNKINILEIYVRFISSNLELCARVRVCVFVCNEYIATESTELGDFYFLLGHQNFSLWWKKVYYAQKKVFRKLVDFFGKMICQPMIHRHSFCSRFYSLLLSNQYLKPKLCYILLFFFCEHLSYLMHN